MAIVLMVDNHRWQLPKGLINTGESAESAAMCDVREEMGIGTEIVGAIDKIDYWYYSRDCG